ncbi:MAG: hypothetical protein OXM56_06390, partial [Gammaproteobacteria bacterium]|nr:hypothetical protein [Gammaproteobacteria bacterium]
MDRAPEQDELSMTLAEFVARYPVSTLVDPIIRRAAAARVPAVLTPLRRLPRNYIGWCFALRDDVPRLPARAVQQLVLALSVFLARHPEPAERGAWFAAGGRAAPMTPEAFHRLAIEALEPSARRVFEARTGIRPRRTLRQLATDFGTYLERIRFLEQQARHILRAMGIRHHAWQALDVAFPRFWPRLCPGGIRYVPVPAAQQPLPPQMVYLCEAVGGFEACLSRYCERVQDGWLLKTDTSRTQTHRALALQAELLQDWRLPQPIPRLALRFDAPERDIEVLLQHGDRLRCEHGYAVDTTRRSVQPALDTALRGSDAPLGVAEMRDRLPDGGAGRRRDLDRTLRSAPQLFLRIWDHQWCSLTELPERLRATPGEDLGSLEALCPDDGTIRQMVLRLVRERGPMTWSELRRAAEPDARGGLASAVARLPDIVKCAPGIYGYRGHVDRDARHPPRTFFREDQAIAWAFGRRGGVSPEFFPLWTPANEMALCRWARDGARASVYESLIAQAEPSDWPGLDAVEGAFWLAERERCSFSLSTARELEFNGVFPASRLLAVLLVATLRGRISWVEANRCMGGRINARSGAFVIALLATMRVLRPDADWRGPHPVQADRARAAIAEFVDVLGRTGRLPWAVVEWGGGQGRPPPPPRGGPPPAGPGGRPPPRRARR